MGRSWSRRRQVEATSRAPPHTSSPPRPLIPLPHLDRLQSRSSPNLRVRVKRKSKTPGRVMLESTVSRAALAARDASSPATQQGGAPTFVPRRALVLLHAHIRKHRPGMANIARHRVQKKKYRMHATNLFSPSPDTEQRCCWVSSVHPTACIDACACREWVRVQPRGTHANCARTCMHERT